MASSLILVESFALRTLVKKIEMGLTLFFLVTQPKLKMALNSIIHDKNTVYDQSRIDFFTKKLATASKEKNIPLVNMYATEIEICRKVMEKQNKEPKFYLSPKEQGEKSIFLANQLNKKKEFFRNIRDGGVYDEEDSIKFKRASEDLISAINEKEAHDAYCKFRDIAEVAMISIKGVIKICNGAPSDNLAEYWNRETDSIRKKYLP